MIGNYLRLTGCILLSLFTFQAFAEQITVTVTTNDPTAAAIGYTVKGKESGGSGKSYTGHGPSNQKYAFGFRKTSVKGKNISCGSAMLTKNSNVTLVTKGNRCHSVISR